MAGFGTSLQGVPPFGDIGVTPIAAGAGNGGFTGADVHGQRPTLPQVSAYSSSTKPLVIDPAYAPFNKDNISGTQVPCSFSGRGAPVCGSKTDIEGSKLKAKRTAAANTKNALYAAAAILGAWLLWKKL